MIATLLSFLGGTAFRMLWGEISAFVNKKQDHYYEIERMRLQGDMDAAAHARNLEAVRLQAELGVQMIRVQGEADVWRDESEAWGDAVRSIGRRSGIWFIDAWNGAIRPAVATVCLFLWTRHLHTHGWVLDEQSWMILGAALGLYIADRSLTKRGK
jgi:hypothetical protein